jgi:hypothetical protein
VFHPLSTIYEDIPASGNEAFFFYNLSFNILPREINFYAIINSVYYKQALKHIAIDAKELITELDSFKALLEEHNKNAKSLRLSIIPALTKREFDITLPAGYEYSYNHDKLLELITYCINEINREQDEDKLESAFSNFDIENLESEYKQNQLMIEGYVITNTIKKEEVETIKTKINNIIKDAQISNNLTTLRDSRRKLRISLAKIQSLTRPISQTIESGDYDIKADCCPTIWILIRKFGF